MPKLIALSLALAGVVLTSSAYADPATDALIFGKDPGKERAFACFVRHYDKTHLASHPKQNVTDMLVLVDSNYDSDAQSRSYALTLGVNFRGIKQQFQSYGGCDGSVEGQKLGCYVDCDGGAIDVRFKDANAILVDIPYSVRIENPTVSIDEEPGTGVPDKAQFWSDDKTFLLARASADLCVGLVNDDDKQALLDAAN